MIKTTKSSKKKYLLGVDAGTSSLKTAVIDTEGKRAGHASCSYELQQTQPGYMQIHADHVWDAFLTCLKKLGQSGDIPLSEIGGIGISCLCPGLTAFDAEGTVLIDPILYSDTRSMEEAEEMKQNIGEQQFFELTANNIMPGAVSAASMMWIKKNLPKIYKQTKYFGHVNTLLAYKMCGKFAIDYSNASYTGLFETSKGLKWSEFLCQKTGIEIEKLPPLKASTDVIGEVCAPQLIACGIEAGTPVIIGGGDTACATYAAGVTKAGDVCESAGTTDVLTVCVDKPKFDRAFINRCHVVEGTWIYQGALSHTGASYSWFGEEFCKDLKKIAEQTGESVFRLMDQEASQARPGSGGIVFLPYMRGERSPVWDPRAKGVFFGLSFDAGRKEMCRAVMEGAGYGLAQLCEIAEKVTEAAFPSFTSIGGGAKSEIWAQIKADITGKDIEILDMNDMAPIGAALLAGVGTGIFADVYEAGSKIEKKIYKTIKSSDAHRKEYDQGCRIYKELYPRIKDLYQY